MTSTPYPRMVSAMSPVTPKPAAEFSTLAITKSMSRCSTSAGMARFAISRPGLPKMSPMNRTRTSVGPHANANLAAAAFDNARKLHAQLTVLERRVGAAHVESAREPHRASEPAERALRQVERRLTVFAGGWALLADDDEG